MVEIGALASVGNFLLNLWKNISSSNDKKSKSNSDLLEIKDTKTKIISDLLEIKDTKTKIIIEPDFYKRGKIIENSNDIIVSVIPNFFAVPKSFYEIIINKENHPSITNVAEFSECLSQINIYNKSNQVISNLILNFKNIDINFAQKFNKGEGKDLPIEQERTVKIDSLHIEEEITLLIWHEMYNKISDLAISHLNGRIPVIIFSHEPSSTFVYHQ